MNGPIKLLAVGDISFGDYPFCPGFGIRSSLVKDWYPFKKNILSIIKQGDIVFGNLETVISDYNINPGNLSSWQMRGPLNSAYILKKAGFTVVNVANNHIMQHGEEAFYRTINAVQAQKINVVGLKEELSNNCKPIIIDCQNCSIGFLGYAFEENIYKDKEIKYSFGPSCNIEQDIKTLKEKVQILVVSCHWGLEFIDKPSPNTIILARNIIEWGADIVLGHHPHVLQGAEYYKRGIIVYSMGNFLFDMIWDERFRESAIFLFEINNNKIQLKIIPIYIFKDYSLNSLQGKIRANSIEKYRHLCDKIDLIMQGDLERNTLRYYLEYERLRKRNKLRSYKYFLRNTYKIDKKYLFQIIYQNILKILSSTHTTTGH